MRLKKEQVNIIVSIFTALIIIFHIFFLADSSKNYVKAQLSNELHKIAVEKADHLKLCFSYGASSIDLISDIISTNLTSVDTDQINTFLNSYLTHSPFNALGFINKDGFNITHNPPYNASNRPDFIEGMKGNSGIWINYKTMVLDEPAIDFYAPLYYDSQIVGVLAAGIGGDSTIKDLLNASYYKKNIIGFLYDEHYNIISSTSEIIPPGLQLFNYLSDPFAKELVQHTELNSSEAFSYFDNNQEGICCIASVPSTDWHVAFVVTPNEYSHGMSFYKETVFGVFLFCTAVMLLYLLFQLYMNKHSRKEKEAELKKVIDALGFIYENVAILNLKNHMLVFYKMSLEVSGLYGTKNISGNYEEMTRNYIKEQVFPEDQILYSDVTTTKDLKKKLDENKDFSFIYRVSRNDELHYYQMQYFRANISSPEVLIVIKNVDAVMAKEIADKNQLNSLIETQSSQLSVLNSLAGIYLTSHIIDLESDTYKEFNSQKEINGVIPDNKDACNMLEEHINSIIIPQYLETALTFTNLKTLPKRLKGKKIISDEMVEKDNGWIRASFVTVKENEEGFPTKVLFLTQQIDAQKKREENLLKTANRDELTGLYNRHAFEEELRRLTADGIKDDLIYISMDVNGLKTVNDKLGHAAGDELLRGAATCMINTFKKFGYVYRTGGDEFQALIYAEPSNLEKIKQNFELETESWAGTLVEELKISSGYVCRSEAMELSITEIGKLADERMYKAKSAYYSTNGVDRRGQQIAYEVLCQSYEKLLKVNLTKDTSSILKMNQNEKNKAQGYSEKFSVWIHDFATSGQVHRYDAPEYLKKTDIEYLRKYFREGNKLFNIQYKRKINSEFHKVIMEMIPSKEYTNINQIVYLYVKSIGK